MFHLAPTITLNLKNQAWKLFQGQEGTFRMELIKEKWSIKLLGYISPNYDSARFHVDPSLFIKEKGKGLNLNKVGNVWKNSGVPLSYCSEIGKNEVPMKIPEGNLRFFVGLVVHPYALGNIYLSATLMYANEGIGKEQSYLGEFYGLLKEFDFSVLAIIPKTEVSQPIRFNFGNTKLERVESYDSGFYSGGGSYSIEESIYLYTDHSCFYRYLKVVSLPGLSGGKEQSESRGNWAFKGNSLDLTLWDIPNQRLAVERLNSSQLLLSGKAFWWSKI
ncbi:MAG: hypothetical protein MUE75_10725 [Algoriphagus sp.]|nr:hypothetical protein [Algoriphagus sp.]